MWCRIIISIAVVWAITGARAASWVSYQVVLTDGITEVNGRYDLSFTIYDAPQGGNLVAGPLLKPAIVITNGLVKLFLDFGVGLPAARDLWMETTGMESGRGGTPAVLGPRDNLSLGYFNPAAAQTLLGAKIGTVNGFANGLTLQGATTNSSAAPSTVAVYDANRVLRNASVSIGELQFLSGVIAPLQTQLDNKAAALNGVVQNLVLNGSTQFGTPGTEQLLRFETLTGKGHFALNGGHIIGKGGVVDNFLRLGWNADFSDPNEPTIAMQFEHNFVSPIGDSLMEWHIFLTSTNQVE